MLKLNERLIKVILSTAIMALSIFLLAPAFIFANNPHDISLEFGNILLAALVIAIAAIAILSPICLFTRSSFIAAGLGLAIAVKLYFLPSFVPLLDGEEIFAKFGSVAGIWSTATLVVLVVAGAIIAQRLSAGALAFIAVTFVLLGVQPLLNAESWAFDRPSLGPEEGLEPGSAEAKTFEFSREGDVMVVLLDTIQSDVFAEVLQEHPEYQEALSGFTYFWNTVGQAPTTLMSMQPIYSGEPYDGGSVSARYADLRRESVFADFEKHGYDSVLVGISIMDCPAVACGDASKLIKVPEVELDLSHYLELVELGLMRVIPTFAHEGWYNRGSGQLRAFLPNVPANHAQRSIVAIKSLASGLSASEGPPRFKVLHLFGAHPPITLDKNCKPVTVKGKPRQAFKELVECNVRTFIALVAALKAASVYDNMTLVLMADHGETTRTPRQALGPFLGVVPSLSERRGRFSPLFAVKLPNADQPLRLNGAPAQISDLRATLCGQVVGCDANVSGEDVFDLEEDARRTRCFIDFLLWQTDHRRLDGMPQEAYQRFCVQDLLVDADYNPSGLPHRSKFK